jgi:hypothetical protein
MQRHVVELLSQEQCARRVVADALLYTSKLVESARRYLENLDGCKYPSLQMDKWVPSGENFWCEFEAYLRREA